MQRTSIGDLVVQKKKKTDRTSRQLQQLLQCCTELTTCEYDMYAGALPCVCMISGGVSRACYTWTTVAHTGRNGGIADMSLACFIPWPLTHSLPQQLAYDNRQHSNATHGCLIGCGCGAAGGRSAHAGSAGTGLFGVHARRHTADDNDVWVYNMKQHQASLS